MVALRATHMFSSHLKRNVRASMIMQKWYRLPSKVEAYRK